MSNVEYLIPVMVHSGATPAEKSRWNLKEREKSLMDNVINHIEKCAQVLPNIYDKFQFHIPPVGPLNLW